MRRLESAVKKKNKNLVDGKEIGSYKNFSIG